MKELYKALADFQAEAPVIFKTTKGYNYKYADLPTIMDTIRPLLIKYGLVITQLVNKDYLETTLYHLESGESLTSFTEMIKGVKLQKMNEFQVMGSQITYLRRYAISSMLGLITDEDNDAAGEQVKKPELTKEVFQDAMASVEEGKYTREQVEKHLTKKYNCSNYEFI